MYPAWLLYGRILHYYCIIWLHTRTWSYECILLLYHICVSYIFLYHMIVYYYCTWSYECILLLYTWLYTITVWYICILCIIASHVLLYPICILCIIVSYDLGYYCILRCILIVSYDVSWLYTITVRGRMSVYYYYIHDCILLLYDIYVSYVLLYPMYYCILYVSYVLLHPTI